MKGCLFFMNTDAINILLLATNIIWGIINTFRTRAIEASQKYAPELIDDIFKPFYQSIECYLFIAVTTENKDIIISNLIDLHHELTNKKLLFYISDSLLISLEEIIAEGTESELFDKKRLNRLYQRFSRDYYFELNRFRKIVGLKSRTLNFRVHHRLYKYKIQWIIIKYITFLPAFLFLIYYFIELIIRLF